MTSGPTQLESLRAAVDKDELMRNTAEISRWIRLSAQPDEYQAAEYVQKTLESYGVETMVHECEMLVSLPESAAVTVLAPAMMSFEAYTHSFSPSTPVGGLRGELVHVGRGFAGDYVGKDVQGKVVLIDGLAAPPMAWAAQQAGAAAAIFISGRDLHFMITSTVWGTPTPDTAWRLPTLPAASIKSEDGDRLKQMLALGETVSVLLETVTDTRWGIARMVEARLPGNEEPNRYVLLSGHLDSWEFGAMDNGSANATMMETMRLLAQRRHFLRRGVRAVFWSGHSHARYAGSTWYVDTFWQDLHDNCVGHVNVDSTGARGATAYDVIHAMSDLAEMTTEVVQSCSGQTPKIGRMGRNSDQSFWGVGVPSMFGAISRVPPEDATEDQGGLASLGISGMPWWWHTVDDTLDKIDENVLAMDTAMVAEAVARLAAAQVLPLDYAAMTDEMAALVAGYQAQAGDRFDLSPVAAELTTLQANTRRLRELAVAVRDATSVERVNSGLMALGRLLIPLNYTLAGPYEQDLAVGMPAFPGLAGAAALADVDAASDQARFVKTKLLRERNRAVDILREANRLVEGIVGQP